MNINDIPAERFTRGLVVSVMEEERPIIETFTKGGKTLTVAFLRGLPMPYEVFSLFMAIKLAPTRSRAFMPSTSFDGDQVYLLPDQIDQELKMCWGRVRIAEQYKEQIFPSTNAGRLLNMLIGDLYAKCKAEQGKESSGPLLKFRDMIRRIDEDHASSLVDPIQV